MLSSSFPQLGGVAQPVGWHASPPLGWYPLVGVPRGVPDPSLPGLVLDGLHPLCRTRCRSLRRRGVSSLSFATSAWCIPRCRFLARSPGRLARLPAPPHLAALVIVLPAFLLPLVRPPSSVPVGVVLAGAPPTVSSSSFAASAWRSPRYVGLVSFTLWGCSVGCVWDG